MVRETSKLAYQQIHDEGLLGKRQWSVYNYLYHHGPKTANELHAIMTASKTAQANDNVSTRLGELRDKGSVREVSQRPCGITGRVCIEWDVTKNIPQQRAKRLTKDEQIRRLQKAVKLLKLYAPIRVQEEVERMIKHGFKD